MVNIEINEKFVEDIFNTKMNKLIGVAYRYLKDRDLAEDIVQETFLDICREIGTKNVIYNLDAWLFTVLKYNCYNHWRKVRRYEIQYLPDEELDRYAGKDIDITDNIYLISKLEKLKQVEKDFITYKYIYGFKNKEIAEIFNCSKNKVSSRMKKGLKKLEEKIQKEK